MESAGGTDRSRNVTRGLGALTIQNLINGLLAFVFLATLARLLPTTSYGAYSAVVIIVGIVSTISVLGLPYAAARYVALFEQDQASTERSWTAARAIFNLTLLFSIITTVIFLLLSPYLSLYFTQSTQWTDLFILGGLWLFSGSISIVVQGIVQGMRKYVYLAKVLTISKIVMVGFTLAGLEFYHDASIGVISWALFNCIIVGLCFRQFGYKFFRINKEKKPYRAILRYSFPLGLASILAIVSTSADQVVVGGYLHLVSLAIYNLAVQISLVLQLVIIIPLVTALLPEIASISKRETEISNGLRMAVRYLALGLLPASFLVAALSSQLVKLFSNGGIYLGGLASLELIALTYIFIGVQTAIGTLLMATGRTMNALAVAASSAIVDIVASSVLVLSYGLIGAAVAKALVGIVGMIIAVYYVRNYIKNLDSYFFYFKAIVASFIPFVVVFSLSLFVSNRTISIIPYVLLWACLFLLSVKWFKLLSDEDKVLISHLLPSKFQKMLNYF
jgi:O-antigen/teichoic acid export membrane protein